MNPRDWIALASALGSAAATVIQVARDTSAQDARVTMAQVHRIARREPSRLRDWMRRLVESEDTP